MKVQVYWHRLGFYVQPKFYALYPLPVALAYNYTPDFGGLRYLNGQVPTEPRPLMNDYWYHLYYSSKRRQARSIEQLVDPIATVVCTAESLTRLQDEVERGLQLKTVSLMRDNRPN